MKRRDMWSIELAIFGGLLDLGESREFGWSLSLLSNYERIACEPTIWPVPGSRLARYVAHLREPGMAIACMAALRRELTPEIVEALRSMPYQRYLETPYWTLVRAWAVYRRGERCEDCGARRVLDLHHLSYAHRAEEIFHLDEMRLLCRECHDARHKAQGEAND